MNTNPKTVVLLTGAPASGKSWVCTNISNLDVLDADIISKKNLVSEVDNATKPLLALTVGVSTFMKRNPQFNYKLIVIIEDISTLENRMVARGGQVTDTIRRRLKRMHSLAKQAEFVGTSSEVLDYIKGL